MHETPLLSDFCFWTLYEYLATTIPLASCLLSLVEHGIVDIIQMVFEGMEESGSEGLDDLLWKLKDEGWMKVQCHGHLLLVRLEQHCYDCIFVFW